ncbi:MAG: Uma2 family endonuclease, partial [Rubrobacteraceae bacterium]
MRYTSVMAESAIPHRPISVREYLDMEEAATIRHEYVSGTIHAQAGATRQHNIIAGNVFARLWTAARGSTCRVFQNDMKLRVSDDIFYYPDVMVTREPEGQNPTYEDTPCLVVEVVSPSTATIDRREKLNAYRKVSTLKSYLIVDQENKQIERHWRDADGL